MHTQIAFSGTPATTTVEVLESVHPASVQGKIQALASFTNHRSGKATVTDVRGDLPSIRLTGNDK